MAIQQRRITYHREFADHPQKNVIEAMLEAARVGSEVAQHWFYQAHKKHGANSVEVLGVQLKNSTCSDAEYEDFLTKADLECEQKVIPILKRGLDIPVVGEETGHEVPDTQIPNGGKRWLIDPIDGTACFKEGIPDYSITLALQEKVDGQWKTLIGAVVNPENRQTYLADENNAYLFQFDEVLKINAREPEVASPPRNMKDVLKGKKVEVVVYNRDPKNIGWAGINKGIKEQLGDAATHTYSTALQVAKITQGWKDGAIIASDALRYPWDTDAAIHIAEKAGLKVKKTKIDGEPCVFIANSQTLLTALERITTREHNKSLAMAGRNI